MTAARRGGGFDSSSLLGPGRPPASVLRTCADGKRHGHKYQVGKSLTDETLQASSPSTKCREARRCDPASVNERQKRTSELHAFKHFAGVVAVIWSAPAERSGDGALDCSDRGKTSKAVSPLRSATALQKLAPHSMELSCFLTVGLLRGGLLS
jgi:hypothetical protein